MNSSVTLTIKRDYRPDRTLGDMITEEGKILIKTQELPNLNNEHDKSCIPEGTYDCKWILSRRLGWVYWLQDTGNRTNIYIHSGNFTSQILGCIETGDKYGMIDGEFAILDSKDSLQKLFNYAGSQFTLIITS